MSGNKPVHGDESDTSSQGTAPLISAEESLRQRLKNQLKDVIPAAALVAGAYFSAVNGHDIIAGGFLATSAVGMVPAFVRGRELFKNNTKS